MRRVESLVHYPEKPESQRAKRQQERLKAQAAP
jgi:hypothetical protein